VKTHENKQALCQSALANFEKQKTFVLLTSYVLSARIEQTSTVSRIRLAPTVTQNHRLLARREHYVNGTIRLILLNGIHGCVRDTKIIGHV
jgi:hypothetical protein